MGLFNFFKKKPPTKEKELHKVLQSIAFEGGHKQEIKEANIVAEFFNHEYPVDQLQKLNRFSNARYILRGFEADSILINSINGRGILKPHHVKPYISYLEAKYEGMKADPLVTMLMKEIALKYEIDTLVQKTIVPNDDKKTANNIVSHAQDIRGTATNHDQIFTGEFGYSPSNPIHTPDLILSYFYISQLCLENGDSISYERTRSLDVPNIFEAVDEYAIYNNQGKFITHLYISGYQDSYSQIAPKGFKIGKTTNRESEGKPVGKSNSIRSSGRSYGDDSHWSCNACGGDNDSGCLMSDPDDCIRI